MVLHLELTVSWSVASLPITRVLFIVPSSRMMDSVRMASRSARMIVWTRGARETMRGRQKKDINIGNCWRGLKCEWAMPWSCWLVGKNSSLIISPLLLLSGCPDQRARYGMVDQRQVQCTAQWGISFGWSSKHWNVMKQNTSLIPRKQFSTLTYCSPIICANILRAFPEHLPSVSTRGRISFA